REVGGCSELGVWLDRPLPHVLIEDRRVIGVLWQAGKEGRARGPVKGRLARRHPSEQMAPRIPQPGRPPIHRHRPERARDVGAEQRRLRGQGKALPRVLREHATTGKRAQHAVKRGRMGPRGRRKRVDGLRAIRQEVRNTKLCRHVQHRRKHEAIDQLLHGGVQRVASGSCTIILHHRSPPGYVREKWVEPSRSVYASWTPFCGWGSFLIIKAERCASGAAESRSDAGAEQLSWLSRGPL